MTETQSKNKRDIQALLVSSDSTFIDRAMEVLNTRMRVAVASDSDDHLETVAQSTDPDIFIIDVDNIDWQVTGRMTTIEKVRTLFPDIPIAFASYDISTATLIPAMRAGANDVFDKSASGDEIVAVTDRLISRRSSRIATGGGKILNIMGLRAGVGATTLCLAVAQTILEPKYELGRVLYLDFSSAPCESADLLAITPNYTMQDAMSDLSRLDLSMIESAFSRSADGLFVLPLSLKESAPHSIDPRDVPNLIHVLKAYFSYIIVDSNRHAFSSATFDNLFFDSNLSILCTDQSVTSIHACSAFLRQYAGAEPDVNLAIARYDSRIAPDASCIARTIGVEKNYHIIPCDRLYVESRRNAGLPLVVPGTRSPLSESARRLMAKVDPAYSESVSQGRKKQKSWQKLFHLGR